MIGGRVLFFPEAPAERAVITKICRASDCAILIDPLAPCDLAIAWDTNTFRAPAPPLTRLAPDVRVWNLECDDIGKAHVDRAFEHAFGYTSLVDPLTYRGLCVSKSELNGAHDGVVIECPVTRRESNRVYQRLIRNESADGTVEDIRTPVFGHEMPFVYLKYRPNSGRFDQFETHVAIEEAAAVFTAEEQSRLVRVCRALGMDYGELDVLRDRKNGRLYVVDANPTPFGPPNLLAPGEQRAAIDRLAGAFDRLRRAAGWRLRRDGVSVGGSLPNPEEPTLSTDIASPFDSPLVLGPLKDERFARDRPLDSRLTQDRPAISVVVVARNEGQLVRDTVAQLCTTLPAPNEILLVDDGSDDGSTDGITEAHPRVQLIRVSGLGVARGRNLGAMRSTGRVIVFADGHLTIPPGWWEPVIAAVNDPRVGGAAPAISNAEHPLERGYGLRFTGFDLDVEWLPRLGEVPYAVPLMPWCFGAMRRDVFEATGGFDAGMIQWGSIDNEMSVRLWSRGYELRIVPDIEVAHVFRDVRPYSIEWTPVLHNTLRLAFVHFEAERIARVVGALGQHPDFPMAVARAVAGDVSARRREVIARRVRDSEWLFRDFETA
jgi:GT2 family glycosyltransferase